MGQFIAKGGQVVTTTANAWTLPYRAGQAWGKQRVDWTLLPGPARPFWQVIARELAETASPMRAYACFQAARFWHRFLAAHDSPLATDFAQATAQDWGAFYEWALQQPNQRQAGQTLSLSMVRHIRSDLLGALQTAVVHRPMPTWSSSNAASRRSLN